jgi:hypothetical protein
VCVAYEWHRSRVQWEMQLGDANIICMCVYVCVYVDQYSLHQLYTALHSTALHCTPLQRLLGVTCSSHSLHCPSTWRSGRERRVPLQESPNRGTYTYSLTHTLLHILSYTYSILYTLYSILYTLYSILYTLYSILYTLHSILFTHSSLLTHYKRTEDSAQRSPSLSPL